MAYAEGTQVSIERSKTELKKTIYKYGGSGYEYIEREDKAGVQFRIANRVIRFVVKFPPPDAKQFHKTPTGRSRKVAAAWSEYEAEQRRRWRALILSIKAKFEAVESGIASAEDEFLPYTVLPDGSTVAENVAPMVQQAYDTGKLPGSMLALPRM